MCIRDSYSGVETFDALSTGVHGSYTTNFGTAGNPVQINGTYSGVTVKGADQYGGAGGVGNYAVAWSNAPYQLSLSASNGSPINYFGYWLSALDSGNKLDFYKGGNLVYTFTPDAVIAAFGNNPAYLGLSLIHI